MKKILLCLLVLNSMSLLANEINCKADFKTLSGSKNEKHSEQFSISYDVGKVSQKAVNIRGFAVNVSVGLLQNFGVHNEIEMLPAISIYSTGSALEASGSFATLEQKSIRHSFTRYFTSKIPSENRSENLEVICKWEQL